MLLRGSEEIGAEGELTPSFTVHVVDEAAREGLQQQAEDGHAGAEAASVPSGNTRVEDANVDNVQEDGGNQATKKHAYGIYRVPLGHSPHTQGQDSEVAPSIGA